LNNIDVRLFRDIENNDKDIRALGYLRSKEVITGYDDLSFRPSTKVSRPESLKFLDSIIPDSFANGDSSFAFNDVSIDDWYYSLLIKAVGAGSINSDGIGSFNSTDGITLPAFLKMIFEGLHVDVDPQVHDTYATYFNTDEWYAPYLQEALKRNVISSTDTEDLSQELSRRDVARITYRLLKIIEDGVDVFND
jgi:hypothetical protein